MTRVIVGIVGPPGSGKTHLARHLHELLVARSGADAARVVAMDGFHLLNADLDRLGRRSRKGAPDTFDAAGFVEHLDRLRAGDVAVHAPAFSREEDEPIADAIVVERHVPVVIVEGNYLLLTTRPWATIADRLDISVYVETPPDVRWRRLLVRQQRTHGSRAAAERWIELVDEQNAALVEATRHRADLVVAGVGLPGSALW